MITVNNFVFTCMLAGLLRQGSSLKCYQCVDVNCENLYQEENSKLIQCVPADNTIISTTSHPNTRSTVPFTTSTSTSENSAENITLFTKSTGPPTSSNNSTPKPAAEYSFRESISSSDFPISTITGNSISYSTSLGDAPSSVVSGSTSIISSTIRPITESTVTATNSTVSSSTIEKSKTIYTDSTFLPTVTISSLDIENSKMANLSVMSTEITDSTTESTTSATVSDSPSPDSVLSSTEISSISFAETVSSNLNTKNKEAVLTTSAALSSVSITSETTRFTAENINLSTENAQSSEISAHSSYTQSMTSSTIEHPILSTESISDDLSSVLTSEDPLSFTSPRLTSTEERIEKKSESNNFLPKTEAESSNARTRNLQIRQLRRITREIDIKFKCFKKIVRKGEQEIVERGCVTDKNWEECENNIDCHLCNEDGCNGANLPFVSSLVLWLVLLFIFHEAL